MYLETRRKFLARSATAGVLLTGCGSGEPAPGIEAGESTALVALRNVTVIDATGKPAMPGQTVVIAGNRIQYVGEGTETGPETQAIDASGKFLIPGLWDMHAHWWWEGISPLFIPNGVTGVRTMGGSKENARELREQRDEIAAGKRLGPRMVVASQTMYGEVAPNPDAGRLAVRDAARDKADFIKIYSGVSRETYFAIVDEAKNAGLTFAGHVADPGVTLEECAKAGQRSFEHMAGVRIFLQRLTGAADNFVPLASLTASQVSALMEVFLSNHAWLCPTRNAQGEDALTNDPRLKYFSDRTKSIWAQNTPDTARLQKRAKINDDLIQAMHMAGIGVLAGTDTAPHRDSAYSMPGFGLHGCLRSFVGAGLSPMEALRTATYKPAEFLGLLNSLGTVESGKLAELVLLDASPLDDIANTEKINAVFTGGKVYRRPVLDAMLKAIEANAKN